MNDGSSRTRRGGTVLVDFDGTISTTDVGNSLFRSITAGGWEAVVNAWKRDEITSRECLIRECAAARATEDAVRRFALAQPVDPGFAGFVQRVTGRGFAIRVVSDGLEVYIRAILEREGLGSLPVEANQVRFLGDRLLPAFPYAGRGCGRCGNCKGGAVEEAGRRGPVIFVGDGLSDRCGARAADRVFAKRGRDLSRFCSAQHIPHETYDSFSEILEMWDGVPDPRPRRAGTRA